MAGKNRSKESVQGKKKISVYVDPEIYDRLKEMANDSDRSISNLASRLIKQHVKKEEDRPSDDKEQPLSKFG